MKRALAACVSIVGITAAAHSAIPNRSKESLQADATHIVTGTVKAIYTRQVKSERWLKSVGVVEIAVDKTEKGGKIEPGDAIYARFWTQKWIGEGEPEPFGAGHGLPKKGDAVRVYLKRKDGGYDALLPNGFEAIAAARPTANR